MFKATFVCLFLLCASLLAADVDYGCYLPYFGSVSNGKNAIKAEGDSTIHLVQAKCPPYYRIAAPAGNYKVVVHYLTAETNKCKFSVELNGKEAVGDTPCFMQGKKDNRSAKPAKVSADVTVAKNGLRVRFPRTHDQQYAISGIEVLGDAFSFRINCGAGKRYTDKAGKTWHPDKALPFPDVSIQLDANDTKGEWVDIGTEIVDKLNKAGADPIVKWKGHYTRHVNNVIVDRSGNTYIGLSGIGLWKYEGPGGKLYRADGCTYTSVNKGESLNPYGPGFVLFCSHGFNDKSSYQALSWDGKTIETWPSDADFGTVDWTAKPMPLIFSNPRHNTNLIISEDGGKTQVEVAKEKDIVNIGALGNNVLVYCVWDRKGKNPRRGMYRSEDKGKTWTKIADDINARGNNCSAIFAYKNRAYLHTVKGLYKSTDYGKTWRLVPDSPPMSYGVQPAEDDTHLLGFNTEGVYESTDQGETWKKIMPPPPKGKKWLQSHSYYGFAWDHKKNVVYAFAGDSVYRYVRP